MGFITTYAIYRITASCFGMPLEMTNRIKCGDRTSEQLFVTLVNGVDNQRVSRHIKAENYISLDNTINAVLDLLHRRSI